MAYGVAWTESAWQELEEAAEYIARDSPHFASALMHEAQLAAQSLKKSPQRGRVVPELREASVREIFVKQYRFDYEVARTESSFCRFFTARANSRRIDEVSVEYSSFWNPPLTPRILP